MIRVNIVEEAKNPGVFRYRVPGMAIEGRSRKPLIDACRQIQALVGPTKQRAGLFREGEFASEHQLPSRVGRISPPGLMTPRYLGHKNIQHRARYSSSPPNTLPFQLTKCTLPQAWQAISS